jgi:hypothetical protein
MGERIRRSTTGEWNGRTRHTIRGLAPPRRPASVSGDTVAPTVQTDPQRRAEDGAVEVHDVWIVAMGNVGLGDVRLRRWTVEHLSDGVRSRLRGDTRMRDGSGKSSHTTATLDLPARIQRGIPSKSHCPQPRGGLRPAEPSRGGGDLYPVRKEVEKGSIVVRFPWLAAHEQDGVMGHSPGRMNTVPGVRT